MLPPCRLRCDSPFFASRSRCCLLYSVMFVLQEAVGRTKIVLKLLENKTAAANTTATVSLHRVATGREGMVANVNDGGSGTKLGGKRVSRHLRHSSTGPSRLSPTRDGLRKEEATMTGRTKTTGKRSLSMVLRRSTEAYSDRIESRGGGRVRHGNRSSAFGAANGSAVAKEAAARGGGGGDRARMHLAVKTVQAAFRRRMFHRFVWAQAYLRRPTHAFFLMDRVCQPAGCDGSYGGGCGSQANRVDAGCSRVCGINGWPEPPGFCPSGLHHVHAADIAFLAYAKWHRNACQNGDGKSPNEGIRSPSPETLKMLNANSAAELPARPPAGAEVFGQKRPTRAQAVHSMLFDLRLPFSRGALDAAIEDLEKMIDREGRESRVVIDDTFNRDAFIQILDTNRAGTKARKGKIGADGGGRGISFVNWYAWWVRHLPHDPASTSDLLKMVRCAKGLHCAEIAAAAAAAATDTAEEDE